MYCFSWIESVEKSFLWIRINWFYYIIIIIIINKLFGCI